jgi:hypothetical protein
MLRVSGILFKHLAFQNPQSGEEIVREWLAVELELEGIT